MIVLHATLTIAPQTRDRWMELLKAVIVPSQAEEACQSYVAYESVDSANSFIFVEEWASLEGLHAHFHTPHFIAFFTSLGEVLAEAPTGTVFDVSSSKSLGETLTDAGVGG